MKHVINTIFITFFCFGLFAQTQSAKLKKEQKKLEKKISNTKNLLKKVSSSREASLNELKLIENQIDSREALLRVYDDQVKMAEIYIKERKAKVDALRIRMEKLKAQYKEMVLYAYKNRNKNGRMMFILSSDNYYEAQKRNKYLKSVSSLHQKQVALITQDQLKINEEIKQIEIEKENKQSALAQKRIERAEIESDRIQKETVLAEIKKREGVLLAEIKKNEIKKQEIKRRITEAIQNELAEIERKRREAERRKRAALKKSGEDVKTANLSFIDESSEGKIISNKFQNNKGSLPWPISRGSITERFGKNQHPTLSGVYTNNNGIDISCPEGSIIRAVFEGEVTSVFTIPGSGKVVILKHGNFRTVYSNLKETRVSAGNRVSTKQALGVVLNENGDLGVLHFEVHQVSGSSTKSLNPSLWIDR